MQYDQIYNGEYYYIIVIIETNALVFIKIPLKGD